MCVSVATDRRDTSQLSKSASRARVDAHTSDSTSWMGACILILVLLGPLMLAGWTTHWLNQKNRPSKEQLSENFFLHEKEFGELVAMLDADRQTLVSAGSETIDLTALSRVCTHAQAQTYRALLRRISVADLRFFLGSGKLILLPDGGPDRGPESVEGPSRSYLYLPQGQSEPALRHHGYNYRQGPGVYFLTGDRPLKGSWFIHYNTMVEVGFSPY